MARQVVLGSLRGTLPTYISFWVVMVIVLVVLTIVQARTGALEEPVFAFIGSGRWFLFVMGIIVPVAMLATHVVGGGGTRRSVVRGLWALAIASGIAFGLLALVMTIVQNALWAANDWPDVSLTGRSYVVTQPWRLALSETVCNAVYYVAGAAVGTGYYRWGGWRGTAALPLAAVPAVVAEVTLQGSSYGEPLARALGMAAFSVPVAVAGSILATALAAGLLHLIVRDIRIRALTSS
ncbi:hypothetical protein Bcav_0483 [Beutenbergia cavernae DSM 12333]|uniref:Uncharacterized protein n=2 Tax=Beutenbergia TaxID=84756 RepID=C5BX71_BEUC1|nr:hypothetical protein Bcav_0483 [Beutenbergia cavernae DSM 12333]